MFQLLGEHLVTQLCVYNGQSFHFPVVKMELNICKNMAVAPNHRIFTRPHTPPNRPRKRHQESALSGREGGGAGRRIAFLRPRRKPGTTARAPLLVRRRSGQRSLGAGPVVGVSSGRGRRQRHFERGAAAGASRNGQRCWRDDLSPSRAFSLPF